MSALLSAVQQALPGFTWTPEGTHSVAGTARDERLMLWVTHDSSWTAMLFLDLGSTATASPQIEADTLDDLAVQVRDCMSTLANELHHACGYPVPKRAAGGAS